MKVLVIDETLGNPSIIRRLLQDLDLFESVEVLGTPKETIHCTEADVIILGGRWLDWAKELRGAFPEAYIVGRSPWFNNGPSAFFPWGDQLRDPTISLDRLVKKF